MSAINPSNKRSFEGSPMEGPPITRPKITLNPLPIISCSESSESTLSLQTRDWVQSYTEIRSALEMLRSSGLYSQEIYGNKIKELFMLTNEEGKVESDAFHNWCASKIEELYQAVNSYAKNLKVSSLSLNKIKFTQIEDFKSIIEKCISVYKECIKKDLKTQLASKKDASNLGVRTQQQEFRIRFPLQLKPNKDKKFGLLQIFIIFIKDHEHLFDDTLKKNLMTYFTRFLGSTATASNFSEIKNALSTPLSMTDANWKDWIESNKSKIFQEILRNVQDKIHDVKELLKSLYPEYPEIKILGDSYEQSLQGYYEFSNAFLNMLRFYKDYNFFNNADNKEIILHITQQLDLIATSSSLYSSGIRENCACARALIEIEKPQKENANTITITFKDGSFSFDKDEFQRVIEVSELFKSYFTDDFFADTTHHSFSMITKKDFDLFYDALINPRNISMENVAFLMKLSDFFICSNLRTLCFDFISQFFNEKDLVEFLNFELLHKSTLSICFIAQEWENVRCTLIINKLGTYGLGNKANTTQNLNALLKYEKEATEEWQFIKKLPVTCLWGDHDKIVNQFPKLQIVYSDINSLRKAYFLKIHKAYFIEKIDQTHLGDLSICENIGEFEIPLMTINDETFHFWYSRNHREIKILSSSPISPTTLYIMRQNFPQVTNIEVVIR